MKYALILSIIALCCIFEVSLIATSYFYADEVTCNFLWCEFKTTRTEEVININQYCSLNGKRINCSDVIDSWETYDES